ncbi:MAG: hypothetical protein M1442_03915 [Candidatus Thermoplasmatota archaeon]|nr:hypothetical protein [Candidatus Thermoplasmatota archaeon]
MNFQPENEDKNVVGRPGLAANLMRRLVYAALSVFFISSATTLWSSAGYLNIGVLLAVWSLLIISGVLLVLAALARPSTQGSRRRTFLRRRGILEKALNKSAWVLLAIVFISFASGLWTAPVRSGLETAVVVWSLLIISGVLLVLAAFTDTGSRKMENAYLVILLSGMTVFFAGIVATAPLFGTDEIAIETYAARLTLNGIDPYVGANMVGVFQLYHVSFYYLTPLLTGGFVHSLNYPGLSVLLMLPGALGWVHSNYVLVFFNLASYPLLFFYYRRSDFTIIFPYAVFVLFLNFNWIYYTAGGLTEIIWLFFLSASYISRNRPWLSGLLYGLSLSSKQTAAAILPFYLYFVYMENSRSTKLTGEFVLAGALSFLLTNLPFILMNPHSWFFSVAGVASQPIIGIGLGPSIISFAGFVPMSKFVFYAVPVIIIAGLFALYVTYYGELRYAFFAFPVIAFVFYYRLLLNYLVYWPFLILLVLPDVMQAVSAMKPVPRDWRGAGRKVAAAAANLRKRKAGAAAVLLMVLGSGIVAGYGYAAALHNPLAITGIGSFGDPFDIPSNITSMNVTLRYLPAAGMPQSIPVFFRILINGPLVSANGMLWSAQSPYVGRGNTTLQIFPDTVIDYVPVNTGFRLIAYYGSFQASYYSAGSKNISVLPMENPLMQRATFFGSMLPAGWEFERNAGTNASYVYTPGRITLTLGMAANSNKPAEAAIANDRINLSSLASSDYILSYSLSVNGGGSTNTGSTFYGAMFAFGNNTEHILVEYSSSVYFSFSSSGPHSIIIRTNQTAIYFSQIASLAEFEHWPMHGVRFMYLVCTLSSDVPVSATFYNFSIRSG